MVRGVYDVDVVREGDTHVFCIILSGRITPVENMAPEDLAVP